VAENNYTGADSRPKGAKKISAPPLYFSAPGHLPLGHNDFYPWGRKIK